MYIYIYIYGYIYIYSYSHIVLQKSNYNRSYVDERVGRDGERRHLSEVLKRYTQKPRLAGHRAFRRCAKPRSPKRYYIYNIYIYIYTQCPKDRKTRSVIYIYIDNIIYYIIYIYIYICIYIYIYWKELSVDNAMCQNIHQAGHLRKALMAPHVC